MLNPASVATDWWDTTGDPQPPNVLERMLVPDDVADALMWIVTRPDHLQIDDLVLGNAANPWWP